MCTHNVDKIYFLYSYYLESKHFASGNKIFQTVGLHCRRKNVNGEREYPEGNVWGNVQKRFKGNQRCIPNVRHIR